MWKRINALSRNCKHIGIWTQIVYEWSETTNLLEHRGEWYKLSWTSSWMVILNIHIRERYFTCTLFNLWWKYCIAILLYELFTFSVLQAIQSLLLYPNADNPASPEIAKEYLSDKNQFDKTAEEWTKTYAVE